MTEADQGAATSAARGETIVTDQHQRTQQIRCLNDRFRQTLQGGRLLITSGVNALGSDRIRGLLTKLMAFSAFTADNDPYGEHDFGAFEDNGDRFFWKVDLYEDPDVKDGNGEPVVTRVLTVMLAEEY